MLLNHCKDLYRLRHMGISRKIFPVPSHQKSLRDDQGQMIHAISGTAERGEVRQQTPGQIPRGETQKNYEPSRRSLTNQFLPSTKSGTFLDMGYVGFKWCLSLWLKSDTFIGGARGPPFSHQVPSGHHPISGITSAFIGGGSTFLLTNELVQSLTQTQPPMFGELNYYIYICNEAWR